MHYFTIFSILKNESESHRNREQREPWYYSATKKLPISETLQPPKILWSSTKPPGFKIKHECGKWSLLNLYAKGKRISQITNIFTAIFLILHSACYVPGLVWVGTHVWGNPEVAAGLSRKDCFTSMGYGALKSTSANAHSAFSALSVFQISS